MESAKDRYAELLSLAVHEFRTPASVVGGYLRMLRQMEDPLSERQGKMIAEAEKSCVRIVELIAELSEIAKLDSGSGAFKTEAFDLFPVLAGLADSVHEFTDRGIRLRVGGEAAGATVSADPARIRTAFGTFFRAILREQPGGATVVVERRLVESAGAMSARVVVAAENDVSPSYDSAPGPLHEQRGGLGLALPIARRVIERHGGLVWSPLGAGPGRNASLNAIVVSLPLEELHH